MSQIQTKFITSDDYWTYQDQQNSDIRKEFGRQASLIETGNKQLRNDINTGNKQLRDDFNNKLATVNSTLSGRLGELNTELGTVKMDLQSLKDEVHQVKQTLEKHGNRLADLGNRFAEHRHRLDRMEGVRMNAALFRLYDKITPIGKFIPGGLLEKPSYFPRDTREFWNLKYNSTEKSNKYQLRSYSYFFLANAEVTVHHLISLVHFYGIDDYQH
jgi:uncharacterized membrane-anchored protein YhcB (DUF1043 family)